METIPDALAAAIRHHQRGQLQAAEQIYRRILEVEPHNADACHLLGLLCTQTGDHHRAVDFISRALGQIPDWAEAQYNLGNAWRAQSRLDEAIGSYRRALELKPNY